MEIQEKDAYFELDYEEMKNRLKALEEENRSLQLETTKNEQGLAESGKLLLSSLRIFNVNSEVKKLVGDLLRVSKNLEQTLAQSSMQFEHMRVLEKEVNDLNEQLMEIKNPGFPCNILDSMKECGQAVASNEPVFPKAVSSFLGPTSQIKADSFGNLVVGAIITTLWHGISTSASIPGSLVAIQGAVLASLLLKFMSDEKEKVVRQELPASSKMVLNGLSCYIRDLEPLTTTADKLDQVLHKGLGMSLFSEEFHDFCLSNKPSAACFASSENLNNFISTLSNDIRQNVLRIMSDEELKKPLEQLAEVVWNETFLKANALYQAGKLLEALPNGYLPKCDSYVLEAIQFACHQVLPANGHVTENSLKEMAKGIVKMRNDFKRITDLYFFTD